VPLNHAAESVQNSRTDSDLADRIEEICVAAEEEAARIKAFDQYIVELEVQIAQADAGIHEVSQNRLDSYLKQAERLHELQTLGVKGPAFVKAAEGRFALDRSTAYDLIHVHKRRAEVDELLKDTETRWTLETIIDFATGRDPRKRTIERRQAKEEKQQAKQQQAAATTRRSSEPSPSASPPSAPPPVEPKPEPVKDADAPKFDQQRICDANPQELFRHLWKTYGLVKFIDYLADELQCDRKQLWHCDFTREITSVRFAEPRLRDSRLNIRGFGKSLLGRI